MIKFSSRFPQFSKYFIGNYVCVIPFSLFYCFRTFLKVYQVTLATHDTSIPYFFKCWVKFIIFHLPFFKRKCQSVLSQGFQDTSSLTLSTFFTTRRKKSFITNFSIFCHFFVKRLWAILAQPLKSFNLDMSRHYNFLFCHFHAFSYNE